MKGTIRPKGRCPKCRENFHLVRSKGFICRQCAETYGVPVFPKRLYIDLYIKGRRVRIFSDDRGNVIETYGAASKLQAHLTKQIEDNEFDPSKYIKTERAEYYLETLFREWVTDKAGRSPKYRRQIAYAEKYIFGHFKRTQDIREISSADIHRFLKTMESVSGKTQQNLMGVFRSFMRTQADKGVITSAPKFPKVEVTQPHWRWLDEEQQAKVLEHIPAPDRPIFLFMALHGARPGEARGLKVSDIDLKRGSITIQRAFSGSIEMPTTKSKRTREIPIHEGFREVLAESCADKLPGAFVFANPRTGRHYAETAIRKIWTKARKQAGVEVTVYEGLRHSWASQRVCNEMPLYLVGKVLGHSSQKVTERYAHVDLKALRAVVGNQCRTVTRLSPEEKRIRVKARKTGV